ncbi:MAG TPA: hypothetical protein VJR23_07535 [Candidatus Acidoferrales bacterium]|nr:hypothetical protein [Candidatus Acidoferrales bacterium]
MPQAILCLFLTLPLLFSFSSVDPQISLTTGSDALLRAGHRIDLVQSSAAPVQNPQPAQKAESQSSSQGTPSRKEASQGSSAKGQQTKRLLWVVPNFAAVSAGVQLPPLTVKEKWKLASEDSFDYSSFVWTGIVTAQSFTLNEYPELGTGAAGYGRYYWRAFTDGVFGTFFTEAIVPSITHEDPRYFTMGEGGFLRRFGYALSRVVITRTDSGGTTFNFSEVGGNALVAGLSNAYYPPQERGLAKTAENWGTQLESAALNNIAKEFWPDIRRDIFRRK